MQVRIKKIVYPGRSLAETDGKVIFTDSGLPGESVEIEIIKEKPSYNEARTISILESSPRRTEPRCSHYKACSPWQDMAYDLQLEIKRGQVREIFTRTLKNDPGDPEIVPSPKIWGYRNRAKFHILKEHGDPVSAYHEPGSEEEFLISSRCHLVHDDINDLLEGIVAAIRRHSLGAVTDVEIRRSSSDGQLLAGLTCSAGAERAALREGFECLRDKFSLAGITVRVPEKPEIAEFRLLGRDFIEDTICGTRFRIGAHSFFQVNTEQLAAVAEEMRAVSAEFRDPRIADLYCGVGTFGLLLARDAREIFGVESEEDNLRFLKKNLALNGIGHYTVCEGRIEEWIEEILDRDVEIVVCDPPRKGLDPRLVQALADSPIRKVIYLSCNPATLARDLKALGSAYEISRLRIFDFFPHTPHIETLAVLSGRRDCRA